MKKIVLVVLLATSFCTAWSQTPISQMPTLSGNPTGAYLPVIFNGINYKIPVTSTGYGKMDTAYARNDSIFGKNKSSNHEFFISVTSGLSGTVRDSTVISADGLHPSITFTLTRTGFKSVYFEYEDDRAGGFSQAYTDKEGILTWQASKKGDFKIYENFNF